MAKQGMYISWWEKVKSGNQDPWEKLRDNDPNGQMKQYKRSNGI